MVLILLGTHNIPPAEVHVPGIYVDHIVVGKQYLCEIRIFWEVCVDM